MMIWCLSIVDNTSREHTYTIDIYIFWWRAREMASFHLIPSMCQDCAQERKRFCKVLEGVCACALSERPCMWSVRHACLRCFMPLENDLWNEKRIYLSVPRSSWCLKCRKGSCSMVPQNVAYCGKMTVCSMSQLFLLVTWRTYAAMQFVRNLL